MIILTVGSTYLVASVAAAYLWVNIHDLPVAAISNLWSPLKCIEDHGCPLQRVFAADWPKATVKPLAITEEIKVAREIMSWVDFKDHGHER
jgi:hypothetical protein